MSEAKGRYDELFAWYKPEENPDAPNWMKVVYNRVKELEQQNKELRDVLVELSGYNFSDIDWNESANIKSLIESVLNK